MILMNSLTSPITTVIFMLGCCTAFDSLTVRTQYQFSKYFLEFLFQINFNIEKTFDFLTNVSFKKMFVKIAISFYPNTSLKVLLMQPEYKT